MRILVFILLLFASHLPPYLEGNYSEDYHGFGGGTWEFSKDGTFKYHEQNCEGGREGNGIYTLDKDSIHFVFKEALFTRPKSEVEVIKTNNEVSGWLVYMNVKDKKTLEDLPFVNIGIKDSNGVVLKTIMTDIEGNGMTGLNNYTGRISLITSYVGYENAAITLEKPGTYKLNVKMVSNFGPATVKQGEKWDYKIIKREKDNITLQTTYPEQGPEGEVHDHNTRFDLVKNK